MKTIKELWTPFEFTKFSTYYFRIGPLKMWLERLTDEWLLAFDYQDEESGFVMADKASSDFIEKPDSLIWRRIVATTDSDRIIFLPVMNEKPVVVGAETPLTIISKNEALIFINVPASFRIMAGTKKPVVLYELPSVRLSNTWVGSAVSGELCLSLKTSAVRKKEDLSDKPNRIGCPVLIKNLSGKPLELDKLCVHTENLGIYKGLSRLWSNKVVISYTDPEKNSEVRILKGVPDMEDEAKLITPPRIPAKDGLLRKSFDLFRLISEI